jgi:hypothetical protein
MRLPFECKPPLSVDPDRQCVQRFVSGLMKMNEFVSCMATSWYNGTVYVSGAPGGI